MHGRLEGLLVALDGHDVITSLLKEDLLARFHLGVGGVAQDDLARQVQAAQQLPRSRDFVALGLGDHPAQKLAAAGGGIDHLHAAMTHFLTIHDH